MHRIPVSVFQLNTYPVMKVVLNNIYQLCNLSITYQSMGYFILVLALTIAVGHSELLYAANLYRHGARYPIGKVDIYDVKASAPNAGELSASGMRQQYNLGRYLRRDYIDNAKLLKPSFNHTEMEVYSTTSLRTVVSAYCQLYGLYPDGTGPTIPDGLDPSYLNPPYSTNSTGGYNGEFGIPDGFQPIPVHDATPYLQNCQGVDSLIIKEVQKYSRDIAQIDLLYTPFYLRMDKIFNLSIYQLNVAVMMELYDVVACDRYLGRPLPPTFTDDDYLNLRHLTHFVMLTAYSGDVSRALSTPLFQKLIKEFDARINGTNNKKWSMFSGHDTNVAPTLTFLNLTTGRCIEDKWTNSSKTYLNCQPGPDFAASITFQLYGGGSTRPTIKILYNGKYANLCTRNQTECDYQQWKSRIEYQYVDYKTMCGNKNTNVESTFEESNYDLTKLTEWIINSRKVQLEQSARQYLRTQ